MQRSLEVGSFLFLAFSTTSFWFFSFFDGDCEEDSTSWFFDGDREEDVRSFSKSFLLKYSTNFYFATFYKKKPFQKMPRVGLNWMMEQCLKQ